MSRKCRECGEGKLKVMGTAGYGDLIEVECTNCDEVYEVEADGLGEGCMEWVEAMMMDEA
jgi:hypothetical protein